MLVQVALLVQAVPMHVWSELQQVAPQAVWLAWQVGGLVTQAPCWQFWVAGSQHLVPHWTVVDEQVRV